MSLLSAAFNVSKPSNLSEPSSLQSGAHQSGGISLLGSAASNSSRGMRGGTVERDTRPGMGVHTQPPSQPNSGRENQSIPGEHVNFSQCVQKQHSSYMNFLLCRNHHELGPEKCFSTDLTVE